MPPPQAQAPQPEATELVNARAPGAFSPGELGVALVLAATIELSIFALVIWAGSSRTEITLDQQKDELLIPIAVAPVLDELPLLKLGSKQTQKPRLPDIWQKRAPVPVKRLEERSAPSEDALDDPDEIPKSELADKEHKAPTEEDEIVKEAIPQLEDEEKPTEEPQMNEEGAADGVEEGTETDPLKARAVDLYRAGRGREDLWQGPRAVCAGSFRWFRHDGDHRQIFDS